MKVLITTEKRQVDASGLVVESLPSIPINIVAVANKLGFTLEELKAKGFKVEEDLT